MTKVRIIYAAVLFAVLGAYAAVYQFYFREKLASYRRDEELKQMLDRTYEELRQAFAGVDPDMLTREWRAQIQPWTDAVTERGRYFNFAGWFVHERPPQEGPILKFWYDEQSNKMILALYQKVVERMGRYDLFPPDIRAELGVPTVDDWAGIDVNEALVSEALSRLAFGIRVCEMMLDAKATRISRVAIWPQRIEDELLRKQTVGLAFSMGARDLVRFIDEQLRTADRYFTIDGLRITYPYIAYNVDPQLNVEMLLTMARYEPRQAPAAPEQLAAAQGAPGVPGMIGVAPPGMMQPRASQVFDDQGMRERRRAQQYQEPGFFGKMWKWFKRYVLYTN